MKENQTLNYIKNLINNGNYNRAFFVMSDYLENNYDDYFAHFLYGKMLYSSGNYNSAAREFKLVLSNGGEGNSIKSLLYLADTAVRSEDFSRAFSYYREAFERTNGNDIYVVHSYVHFLKDNQLYEQALDILSQTDEDNLELMLEKVSILRKLNRDDDANNICSHINSNDVYDKRKKYLEKAITARGNNDLLKARFYLSILADFDIKDDIYYDSLLEDAKLSIKYDDIPRAKEKCNTLRASNKLYDGEVYLLLGDISELNMEYESAYGYYYNIVVDFKNKDILIKALYKLGTIDFARGKLDNAEEIFKRCASLSKTPSVKLYTKLIGVLYRNGEYNEAMNYYNKLKKANPKCLKNSPLEYLPLMVDKKKHKRFDRQRMDSYAERQIVKYRREDAVNHVRKHKQTAGRGSFMGELDLDEVFCFVEDNLDKDNLITEELMDIYEVPFTDAGYDRENNLVHFVRVVALPGTRNIITMYPGYRAEMPTRGFFSKHCHSYDESSNFTMH